MYFIDRETQAELSEAEMRRATRERASLGDPIAPDAALALGYDLVNLADQQAYDSSTHKLVRGLLASTGPGSFSQSWEPVLLSPSELDAKAAEAAQRMEASRARKVADINQARVSADGGYFEFGGKQIDTDLDSMRQINAVTNHVALMGDFPPGFPGAWKAVDNSYLPIPDVATWKEFISTMASKGVANFLRQQSLKADIAAASTMSAIDSIAW